MSNQMLVVRSSRIPRQGNLPILSINATELEIYRLNPSAWIEARAGVRLSGSLVNSVVDRTGNKVWSPLNEQFKPTLLRTSKGIPYFQFGKIGVLNGGILTNETPCFPVNGVYSLACLVHIPERNTGGWAGTGGNFVGNRGDLAASTLYRARLGADQYTGNVVFLNHGGGAVSGTDNYPINSSYPFRGKWFIHYITVTPTNHRWEIDGAVLSQTAYPAKGFGSLAEQQLMLGGAGGVPANGLQGFVASTILVPGEVPTAGKAAIMRHLQSIKASLEEV